MKPTILTYLFDNVKLPANYIYREEDIRKHVKYITRDKDGKITCRTQKGDIIENSCGEFFMEKLVSYCYQQYITSDSSTVFLSRLLNEIATLQGNDEVPLSPRRESLKRSAAVYHLDDIGYVVLDAEEEFGREFIVLADFQEDIDIRYNNVYITSAQAMLDFHETHLQLIEFVKQGLARIGETDDEIASIYYEEGRLHIALLDKRVISFDTMVEFNAFKYCNKLSRHGYKVVYRGHGNSTKFNPAIDTHRSIYIYQDYDHETGETAYAALIHQPMRDPVFYRCFDEKVLFNKIFNHINGITKE